MADTLRSTTPVPAAGGFLGRQPEPRSPRRSLPAAKQAGPEPDQVVHADSVEGVRQLLRQLVLARTRLLLGLDPSVAVVAFAEDLQGEPVSTFVGRLMSAQNLLGARRQPLFAPAALRAHCDAALREGLAEARELLAAAGDQSGLAVLAEVLAEYERRVAS